MDVIQIQHGAGGRATKKLIDNIFLGSFKSDFLLKLEDSAQLFLHSDEYAYTTDAFVVSPIFFEGGDIGKLAVCGISNDLACKGAKAQYLTISFIIEEGFPIEHLGKISKSISESLTEIDAQIVAGDTKVVEKGRGDGVYISASGIGKIVDNVRLSAERVKAGNSIIISGTIAQHESAIISAREKTTPPIKSDVNHIWHLVKEILSPNTLMLRDPTRGGLATVLNEIAISAGVSIVIDEDKIPISNEAKAVSEILGFDPLYMASEGRVVIIAENSESQYIINTLKKYPDGENAEIIGRIEKGNGVLLNTVWGGTRLLQMLEGEQLSRIC